MSRHNWMCQVALPLSLSPLKIAEMCQGALLKVIDHTDRRESRRASAWEGARRIMGSVGWAVKGLN